jgi:hypothetical protein
MFTKFTTGTLVASIFLVACDAPVETNEMAEIPPYDAEAAAQETLPDDTMPAQTDLANPDQEQEMAAPETAVVIDGLDLRGTYAMSGVACDFLAGTMTIAETSIRLTETVCKITQSREVNASTIEYALSDCEAEGAAAPDRTIIAAQDEFGNILVTKWNEQTFEYNLCPS